jgi:hypothetical protein
MAVRRHGDHDDAVEPASGFLPADAATATAFATA